jgi:glucose-1-phosphate cytidylyltransferase
MKVAILAGGYGTRLQEETTTRPKPMVEVGGRPLLWHIMKSYHSFGFSDFIVLLGYKGEVIKDYFLHYRHRANDLTIDTRTGETIVHDGGHEDWTVHLLDTGLQTMTGGRMRRLAPIVGHETFMLTYGDGLVDADLRKVLEFHKRMGRLATVTAVRPPARFGGLHFDGDLVSKFDEKPQIGEGWINGGFFVLEPKVLDYIDGDATTWEREPLERLAAEGQLAAYRHESFWQCVDTMRDLNLLESMWQSGTAPWKRWDR